MKQLFDQAIVLADGDYRAQVADPAEHAAHLGSRYVHGGYILEWLAGERALTDRPHDVWNPAEGCGLPEVFEWGLGWHAVDPGQPFLRVGVGKMIKSRDIHESAAPLVDRVAWQSVRHSEKSVSFTCEDSLTAGDDRFSYCLTRTVELAGATLVSSTQLHVECPWNTPVNWFAHPFFRQSSLEETAIRFEPAGCPVDLLQGEMLDNTGQFRFSRWRGSSGSGAMARMLAQAQRLELAAQRDIFRIEIDHPIDHFVIFATDRVFSPEPQIARAWPSGASIAWSIRYTHEAVED